MSWLEARERLWQGTRQSTGHREHREDGAGGGQGADRMRAPPHPRRAGARGLWRQQPRQPRSTSPRALLGTCSWRGKMCGGHTGHSSCYKLMLRRLIPASGRPQSPFSDEQQGAGHTAARAGQTLDPGAGAPPGPAASATTQRTRGCGAPCFQEQAPWPQPGTYVPESPP